MVFDTFRAAAPLTAISAILAIRTASLREQYAAEAALKQFTERLIVIFR